MPGPVVVELVGSAAAVREARAVVRTALAAWDLDDLQEVAALLTSEVVTNAVVHASGVMRLSVSAEAAEVVVAVLDPAPADGLRPPAGGAEDERGRGLLLVEALASRWGVDPVPGGKIVWFSVVDGSRRPGGLPEA